MIGIRNPNFGNSFAFDPQAIVRRLPSGELKTMRRPVRVQFEKFKIAVAELSDEEKALLITFFNTSIGQEIEFIDHETRIWFGIILTNPIVFTKDGRGCRWSTEWEFEGLIITS